MMLLLLQLSVVLAGIIWLAWAHGIRLLGLVAPWLAQICGVSLSIGQVHNSGCSKLVLQLHKGPIKRLEIDKLSIQLLRGFLASANSWLQGHVVAHITVSGIRLQLSNPSPKPNKHRPRSPASATATGTHDADIQKAAKAIQSALGLASKVSFEVSNVSVVGVASPDLVLSVPDISWQQAGEGVLRELTISNPSLSTHTDSAQAGLAAGGLQGRELSRCSGVCLRINPSQPRGGSCPEPALRSVSLSIGTVHTSLPVALVQQLAQADGSTAGSPTTSPASMGHPEHHHVGSAAQGMGPSKSGKLQVPSLVDFLAIIGSEVLGAMQLLVSSFTVSVQGVTMDVGLPQPAIGASASSTEGTQGQASAQGGITAKVTLDRLVCTLDKQAIDTARADSPSPDQLQPRPSISAPWATNGLSQVGYDLSFGWSNLNVQLLNSTGREVKRAGATAGDGHAMAAMHLPGLKAYGTLGGVYQPSAAGQADARMLGLTAHFVLEVLGAKAHVQQAELQLLAALLASMPARKRKSTSARAATDTFLSSDGLHHVGGSRCQGQHVHCVPPPAVDVSFKSEITQAVVLELQASSDHVGHTLTLDPSSLLLEHRTPLIAPTTQRQASSMEPGQSSSISRAGSQTLAQPQPDQPSAGVQDAAGGADAGSEPSISRHSAPIVPPLFLSNGSVSFRHNPLAAQGSITPFPMPSGSVPDQLDAGAAAADAQGQAADTADTAAAVGSVAAESAGLASADHHGFMVTRELSLAMRTDSGVATVDRSVHDATVPRAASLPLGADLPRTASEGVITDKAKPVPASAALTPRVSGISQVPGAPIAAPFASVDSEVHQQQPELQGTHSTQPRVASRLARFQIDLGQIQWQTRSSQSIGDGDGAQGRAGTREPGLAPLFVLAKAEMNCGILQSPDDEQAAQGAEDVSGLGPIHLGLQLSGPQLWVSSAAVRALTYTAQCCMEAKQVLKEVKARGRPDADICDGTSQGSAAARVAAAGQLAPRRPVLLLLDQVDVQVHAVEVHLSHTLPVVEALSSMEAPTQAAAESAQNQLEQGSTETAVRQLPACHQVLIKSCHVSIATSQRCWAARVQGVQLKQELPEQAPGSLRTAMCSSQPAVATWMQPGSFTRGPSTRDKGRARPENSLMSVATIEPSVQLPDAGRKVPSDHVLTPLTVDLLELKSRASPDRRFLRLSMDGVRLQAEFDVLLMTLGLATDMTQHAAGLLRTVAGLKDVAVAPSSTAQAAQNPKAAPGAPLALDVRVAELDACVRVGERDSVLLTCGLARASSTLQEAVLDDVLLLINTREVIRGQFISVKLAEPLPGDPATALSIPHPASAASKAAQPAPNTTRGPSTPPKPSAPVKPDLSSPCGSFASVRVRGGDGRPSESGSVSRSVRRNQLISPRETCEVADDPAGRQEPQTGWQLLAHEGTALLGLTWEYEPTTTLGNRRVQLCNHPGATSTKTVHLRRMAARERFGLASASQQTPPSPVHTSPAHMSHAQSSDGPSAGADAGSQQHRTRMIGIDLVVEGACVSLPHDEAPMRVYVLCETWAKAVKQVLTPCIQELKQQLARLKVANGRDAATPSSTPASTPAAPGPWPLFDKYVEIILEARRVSLALAQHPLEAWLATHMSALQQTAAERQLWERMLATLPAPRATPDTSGRPSMTHGGGGGSSGNLRGPLESMNPFSEANQSLQSALNTDDLQYRIREEGGSVTSKSGETDEDLDSNTDSSSDDDQHSGGLSKVVQGVQGSAASALSRSNAARRQEGVGTYWEQVMRKVASVYQSACRDIQSQMKDGTKGALLSVSAAQAGLVLMVCKPGVTARAHTAQHIWRLDEASHGLMFEKMVPLSIDASLTQTVIRAACVQPPLSTISSLSASGLIIRARQLTATPTCTQVVFKVGRFHQAPVDSVVKGSRYPCGLLRVCDLCCHVFRAPMKAYTELKVDVDEVEAGGGMGLEPVIGQLVKAIKRVVPPDNLQPDGSAVPLTGSASLPPWDKCRYMWRGTLRANVRGIKAVMAMGLNRFPGPQDSSLHLTANTLNVQVDTGRLTVNMTGVSVLGLSIAPEGSPGDPLLLLPFCHLPLLCAHLNVSWVMSGDRDPAQHHVFPLRFQEPSPEEVQEPLDIPGLVKSDALVLGVDITLSADYTDLGQRQAGAGGYGQGREGSQGSQGFSGPLPHGWSGGAGSGGGAAGNLSQHFTPGPGLAPSPIPRAYIGELQVAFIKNLIDTIKNAPVNLKQSAKKRCFYEPPRQQPASVPPAHTTAHTAAAATTQHGVDIIPSPFTSSAATQALATPTKSVHNITPLTPTDSASIRQTNTPQQSVYQPSHVAPTEKPTSRYGGGRYAAMSVSSGGVQPQDQVAEGGEGSWQAAGLKPPAFVPLGALMSRVDIRVESDVLEVHHDAQDPEDVSDFVLVRAHKLSFAANTSFDRHLSVITTATGRQILRWVKQVTSTNVLSLDAHQLVIAKPSDDVSPSTPGHPDAAGGSGGRGQGSRAPQPRRPAAAASREGAEGDASGVRASQVPGFGQGRILTASKVQLSLAKLKGLQLPSSTTAPGQRRKRPLRMEVHDVQLYASAVLRDTLVATVMHLISAFTRPSRPPPSHAPPAPTTASGPGHSAGGHGPAVHGGGAGGEGGGGGGLLRGPQGSFKEGADRQEAGGEAAWDRSHQSAANNLVLPQEAVSAYEAALLAALIAKQGSHAASLGSDGLQSASFKSHREEELDTADDAIGVMPEDLGHTLDRGEIEALTRPADRRASQGAALSQAGLPHSGGSDVAAGSPLASLRSSVSGGHYLTAADVSASAHGGSRHTMSSASTDGGTGVDRQGGEGGDGGDAVILGFEIAFIRVQVVVVPVNCSGALLFATNTASLTISHQVLSGTRRLQTSMSQLQAYAVRQLNAPSPGADPVPWLTSRDGKLAAAAQGTSLSTMMSPFNLIIAHSKQAPGAGAGAVPLAGNGNELVVQLPSVEGVLEPWQFEMLMDVIHNVLMCPVPTVSMLLSSSPESRAGAAAGPAADPAREASSSVLAAREMVAVLGKGLHSLHQEVNAFAPGALQTAWLQPGSSLAGEEGMGLAPPPAQLLSALLAPGPGSGPGATRARALSKDVLLAWCIDQVSGAADSADAARAVLSREEVTAELLARRASPVSGRRGASPMSCTVVVGSFSWALSKGGNVFLAADLNGLEYTSALNKDYTGSTRFTLKGLSVREVPSIPIPSGPTQATFVPAPARHVLKLWMPAAKKPSTTHMGADETLVTPSSALLNPSHRGTGAPQAQPAVPAARIGGLPPASTALVAAAPPAAAAASATAGKGVSQDEPAWDYEFALSMAAVHGGVEPPNFVVYDHIEVRVHPLELHLTYGLALALQDYFALEESSSSSTSAAATTQAGNQNQSSAQALAAGSAQSSPALLAPALSRVEETDMSQVPKKAGWFQKKGAAGLPVAGGGSGPAAGLGAGQASGSVSARSGGSAALPAGPLHQGALTRHALSSSAGGGSGLDGRVPPLHSVTEGITAGRSRALTADHVVVPEPNRYGSVYRRRSRQLSARGMGSAGGSMALMDTTGLKPSRRQRFSRKSARKAALAGAAVPAAGGGASAGAGEAGSPALTSIPRTNVRYKFKHVRFNRMHARLTYEGPPINMNSFGLVLDHCVYLHMEGTWKTLLNKYKWDVVRSIVKSMAGMQKGKVQELERGGRAAMIRVGGLASDAAGLPEGAQPAAVKSSKLRQNLKALLRIGKRKQGDGGGGAGTEAGTADDLELAELLQAWRQRQARLGLLLGQVPPAPSKRVLLEHESAQMLST